MRSDHIADLANRYEHDELAQLLLLVEQLEVGSALLRTEAIATPVALILLDHTQRSCCTALG